MIAFDTDRFFALCDDLGLEAWRVALAPLLDKRLSEGAHGDFPQWQAALDALAAADPSDTESLRDHLLTLSPWRKGPFDIAGIHIDAEWRSDQKWARLADRIEPLAGRNVLDVGSGNGYYALQMIDAGAKSVIGVDPTILYALQFLAVNHFHRADNAFVIPARLEELPDRRAFDTTFSMGVLYHQRSPIDHLRQLRAMTRPGGQLVLETLFLPGQDAFAMTPTDRYARMRNVWLLPTLAELTTWLHRSSYTDIQLVDTAVTTTNEQRSTDWMIFESLAEALDPGDPTRTVEGLPAPQRVVVLASPK